MNKAREIVTQRAVEYLSKLDGKNAGVEELERMLNSLSDAQFDDYMRDLQSGEEVIPYWVPNLTGVRLNVERNMKIADELGHDFFQRLWLTDPITGQTYLTPRKHMVLELPLKRLQQHLQKKIAIPKDNRRIDDRTGQPTGDSKGSGISFPELQVMYSQGLNKTIQELFTVRGGNNEAYNALAREALYSEFPSVGQLDIANTRVKSTQTLGVLMKSAHIDNNL